MDNDRTKYFKIIATFKTSLVELLNSELTLADKPKMIRNLENGYDKLMILKSANSPAFIKIHRESNHLWNKRPRWLLPKSNMYCGFHRCFGNFSI